MSRGPEGFPPPHPSRAALEAWDQLSVDDAWPVELKSEWLRAEWARVTPHSHLEICEVAGRPRAAATWMLLDGSEERAGYGTYDVLLGYYVDEALRDAGLTSEEDLRRCSMLRERLRPLASRKTVTLTTTGTYFPGLVWDRSADEATRSLALCGMLGQVIEAARRIEASFLAVVNVPEDDLFQPLRDTLRAMEFVRVSAAPDSALRIPRDGIDGYIRTVRSSFRQAVRKERKAFLLHVDRVSIYDASRLEEHDVSELLLGKYEKYRHATAIASVRDRVKRIASIDGVRVVAAERAGKMLGFAALVPDRTRRKLVPRLSACLDSDAFVYFNLIFYELIRLGAEWGYEEIALGSTAYRAKMLRGAHLLDRSTFVRPLDGKNEAELHEGAAFRNGVEEARRRALMNLEVKLR